MPKTKKNHPTACKGLNKTNCIFPCELVKRKIGQQVEYCRSKFKRLVHHAKTKKEKDMLLKKGKKVTQKLMKAKRKIEKGTDEVKKATDEMGIVGRISNFFQPKVEAEVPTEEAEVPKVEAEVEVPMEEAEVEVPTEEAEVPETNENEIEKPVTTTTDENNVVKQNV